MGFQFWFALVIFAVMYGLIIAIPKRKVFFALGAAALFLITGMLTPGQAFRAINWNALMMIAGTMVLVDFFIDSKMPARIADLLLDKAKNVCAVIILMSLFAGIISAFIDNVATVLMIAPVAIVVCRKLHICPVPMLLSIAVSSNLQGAATLVGDTTSIMLGAYAGMDFMQFFWFHGRPGMFFAVELGALLTVPIMYILFRKFSQPVESREKTPVIDFFPSVMLVLMVVLLILVSFVKNKPDITNGVICMILAAVTAVYEGARAGSQEKVQHALKSLDFQTLLLLTGLFVVIEGVSQAGIIDAVADIIAGVGGHNLFLLYSVIVWVSVLISAFIDNIPYVATMLPVIRGLTSVMGIEPYLLYFGLLCGATLGGNITPIGASANITATGILNREGYEVSFKDFAKIGIPFTLTAVVAGYLFIWFVWR